MAFRSDSRRPGDPDSIYALIEPGGRMMILGRPTLMWQGAPDPETYFKALGFSEVHSMDISDRDGATFSFDLNNPEPPKDLLGRYRAVSSGGTLEHVYNLPNAIRTALSLLEKDGIFIFATPANNWMDHGFYQVSPTLKFDLCAAFGLECEESMLTLTSIDRGHRFSLPLYPFEANKYNFVKRRAGHQLVIRKTRQPRFEEAPLQSIYRDEPYRWRFRAREAKEVTNGEVSLLPSETFKLDTGQMKPTNGRYVVPFFEERYPPSIPRRPFRSTGVLYEDGVRFDWIVSNPEMVAERPSSFTHFNRFVHFTARDGSDPRLNGRLYEIAFPQMPTFD